MWVDLETVIRSEEKGVTIILPLFGCQVASDTSRPHGLQHSRLLCPSPSSFRMNQWCHPTISSSVAPVSFFLKSFPASGSFPVSQLFVSGGQIIGVSSSASDLPKSVQGWFPLRLTDLILLSKEFSRVFSSNSWKAPMPILQCSAFFFVQLSYLYMTIGKMVLLDEPLWQVMSLLFNTLSRFVIAFQPRTIF